MSSTFCDFVLSLFKINKACRINECYIIFCLGTYMWNSIKIGSIVIVNTVKNIVRNSKQKTQSCNKFEGDSIIFLYNILISTL